MTGSALYEGTVAHRRHEPAHSFRAKVVLPCLDLDEVDDVVGRSRLWSSERRNLVSLRRRDRLGPVEVPLAEAVRSVLREQTGSAPEGSIRVLAHPRTWGVGFNPLTTYLCAGPDGATQAAVLEVTNTPWGERHAYAIDGLGEEHRFDKELHVSPFFGMDHGYRCRLVDDGERIDLRLDLLRDGEPVFESHLDLRARPLDAAALRRVALDPRGSALAGLLGIYGQAARLRRRGARFHPHPRRSERGRAGSAPVDVGRPR